MIRHAIPLASLPLLLFACAVMIQGGVTPHSLPVRIEPVSVHDRPSGFEATVAGRALESDGGPAAGALVTLYERYPGWSGGWRILAQMNSDTKGDFAFEDIEFSDASQVIDVRGGADFAVKVTPLSLVTCGHMDVGEVKLDPYFVLEGRFDGPLPGTRNWFQLLNPERGSVVRGVQLSEDRTFRLAGLRAGEYRMRVFSESRIDRQTTRVTYDAKWTWDASKPRQRLRLDADGEELLIRPGDPDEPIAGRVEEGKSERLAGRVVDEDGRPLPGLTVSAYSARGQNLRPEPGASSVTGPDGEFDLEFAGFEAARLWITSAHGSLGIEFKPIKKQRRYGAKRIHVEPGTSMHIVAPTTRVVRLPSQFEGQFEGQLEVQLEDQFANEASVGSAPIEYSIRRRGFWAPVPREVAEVGFEPRASSLLVSGHGYLPRIIVPAADPTKWTQDGSRESLRRLRITGADAPLQNARVYLRQLDPDHPAAAPQVIGELLPEPKSGEFRGRAPHDVRYEAVVTAPGHTPAIVLWGDEPTTHVTLLPLTTRVVFEGVQSGEGWVVGHAGRGTPLAAWSQDSSNIEAAPERWLAPGQYDGLLFGGEGRVIAAQTFQVTGDLEMQRVDARADRRVAATLHLPLPPAADADEAEDDERASWNVWVTRGSDAGGTAGAAAMTTMGGAPGISWPTASVEVIDETTRRLLFHGSGRYRLHVRDDDWILDTTLFRDVTIPTTEPDEAPRWRLPELTGVLLGSMTDFNADQGFSHHGVAGPRYLLRAATSLDQDLGWSAIGFVPTRVPSQDAVAIKGAFGRIVEGPEFKVAHLPPGDYLFEDHLYESGWGQDGKLGGWRVTLDGAGPTDIGDVNASIACDVELQVLGPEGAPITDATVTALDPMAEAWAAFKRQPSTATMAEYPIAAPFSARLDEEGKCTIPRLRRDAVVLELTLDRGVRMSALVPVTRDPKPRVTWVLPTR